MSIPMEHVGGFHHLPALSLVHCLHIVRITILSDGIWFLVVVLIGIPSVINSMLSILSHDHSVVFLSFFLKECEENWPLKLASWKSVVFGIYVCNTYRRTFSDGSYHYQPVPPLELEMPVIICGQVVVIENVHKAAVILHARHWFHMRPEPSGETASWTVN